MCGATETPRRRGRAGPASARTIPAHVKRAVRKRDQVQCAFVGDDGRRCAARKFLEFDHWNPVARGGEATVENVRLLCRAHNLYEAERALGAEFMRGKREAASEMAAEARRQAATPRLAAG
jgi:5-methylcytosine-specific restriction endonuclease McrA